MLGIGDPLCIQPFGHDVRERAFPDPYGTLYCDVPGQIEELGHENEEIAFENIPSAASAQLRKKLTAGVRRRALGFRCPASYRRDLLIRYALAGTG